MTRALDEVLLEVLRHELLAVSEEMNITMRQTTRSVAAKETNDFSSALLDRNGVTVAQAAPYGFRAFVHTAPYVVEKFAGRFQDGDAIVTNDPYRGASHLPDILVMMPVFWRGELVGFTATFQHHTDLGGRFPGGFGSDSRQVYEEGLCLPIVHFYRGGEPVEAVHDIIAINVRAPDDVLGDLEANVAACRRGAAGLVDLYDRYGPHVVEGACSQFQAATERYVRSVIRQIPDGTYPTKGGFDDGRGTILDLALTLRVDDDHLTIDLTGCAPQSDLAWNIPPGLVLDGLAPPLIGLLGHPDLVVNAGLLAPVTLEAPPGTVVNPLFPAAVASRAQPLSALADLMLDALAQALPERIPAPGEGGMSILVFTEERSDGKAPGVLTDIWSGGWGARAQLDGIDGVIMMAGSGFRTSSGEMIELESPVALDGFGFVPDTGGPGRFRGNLSMFRRYRFLADGRIMLRTTRSNTVAVGRAGGKSGGPFSAWLVRDGNRTELARQSVIDVRVRAGDVVEHIVSGGGGHGDAVTRDPTLVLRDVLDGKVSPQGAARDYGVTVVEGSNGLVVAGRRSAS